MSLLTINKGLRRQRSTRCETSSATRSRPRPSTRISTLGDSTHGVCRNRQTDIKRLSHFLRGELDWVVMKAIDKNRSRRYETAREFSLDISRFLNQEPVQACPPSSLYQIRKFVRRHRTAVVTGVALITLLTAGIVGTTTGWWNAAKASQKMRKREQDALKAQRRGWQGARSRNACRDACSTRCLNLRTLLAIRRTTLFARC